MQARQERCCQLSRFGHCFLCRFASSLNRVIWRKLSDVLQHAAAPGSLSFASGPPMSQGFPPTTSILCEYPLNMMFLPIHIYLNNACMYNMQQYMCFKFDSIHPWLFFIMYTILIARQCSPDFSPPPPDWAFFILFSLLALCSSFLPLHSRSIVNGTFSDVKEAMFSHMPSLQLL